MHKLIIAAIFAVISSHAYAEDAILTPNFDPPADKTVPLESNKAAMRLMLSTRICRLQSSRAATLAEVAKQKKYSRVGGVQNNLVMYNLQRKLRLIDDDIAEDRKSLATWPSKALSCGAADVKAMRGCADDGGACADTLSTSEKAKISELVTMITEYDSDVDSYDN